MNNRGNLDNEDWISLLNELQISLYRIARSSEIGAKNSLSMVNKEANVALKFIDIYLDYNLNNINQTKLELTTIGIGDVFNQVAWDVKKYTDIDIDIDNKSLGLIYSNPSMLKNILFSLGYFIAESGGKNIVFRASKTKSQKIEIGVLAKNFDIRKLDFVQAIKNKSVTMPMANISNKSIIPLVLAEQISNVLNEEIKIKKSLNSKGFSIFVPISEQLKLV